METIGVDDGERATFHIWERDANRQDRFMARVFGTVKGGKAEAKWTYLAEDIPEDGLGDQNAYSTPDYYFIVNVAEMTKRSGILVYNQDIEIVLLDPNEEPIVDTEYRLTTRSGDIRSENLDSDGGANESDLPPGKMDVEFVGLDSDKDDK